MGDNQGDKDNNSTPMDHAQLTWEGVDKVPHVANSYRNPGPTTNLRGVEANTNKDKGSGTPVTGLGSSSHHVTGVDDHHVDLPECC